MPATAYDADPLAWAKEQARALAERRFGDLDLEHLVEELEDLGTSERSALESNIIVLLAHLLKWQYQSDHRSHSWFCTIREHRRRIARLLTKIPSLKPTIEDVTLEAFEDALEDAMDDTKLPRDAFPETCPFGFDDLFRIEVEDPA